MTGSSLRRAVASGGRRRQPQAALRSPRHRRLGRAAAPRAPTRRAAPPAWLGADNRGRLGWPRAPSRDGGPSPRPPSDGWRVRPAGHLHRMPRPARAAAAAARRGDRQAARTRRRAVRTPAAVRRRSTAHTSASPRRRCRGAAAAATLTSERRRTSSRAAAARRVCSRTATCDDTASGRAATAFAPPTPTAPRRRPNNSGCGDLDDLVVDLRRRRPPPLVARRAFAHRLPRARKDRDGQVRSAPLADRARRVGAAETVRRGRWLRGRSIAENDPAHGAHAAARSPRRRRRFQSRIPTSSPRVPPTRFRASWSIALRGREGLARRHRVHEAARSRVAVEAGLARAAPRAATVSHGEASRRRRPVRPSSGSPKWSRRSVSANPSAKSTGAAQILEAASAKTHGHARDCATLDELAARRAARGARSPLVTFSPPGVP